MKKQPQVRSTEEALRLADALEGDDSFDNQAAAELRRLHKENAELAAGQCLNVVGDEGGRPYCRLHEVNQELLEALKTYGAHSSNCDHLILLTSMPPQRKPCSCGLHAAIAKAGEQP